MAVSTRAAKLVSAVTDVKLGDFMRRAKEIKTDHDLALELWATGAFFPRLLSVLILDKKLLTQSAIDKLASDILEHDDAERDQPADWLLANQLTKDRKLISLMETWESNPSPILRRLFWCNQARLRWTGRARPGDSRGLLDSLERDLADAEPVVQWAMNFCAGQIGIREPSSKLHQTWRKTGALQRRARKQELRSVVPS